MGSSSSRVSRSEELAFERSELSELSLDEYWWLGSVPGMLSSDWDRCVHTQRELLDIVDRAWIRNEDLDENRRLQRGKDTSRGMDAESSRCDDGDLRVHVDVGCLGYFAHRVLLSREERDRDEKDEEEDEDWASTIQAVESVCANGTRLGARMEDLVPLVQLQLSGRTLSRSAYDRYGSSQGVSLFRCLVSLEMIACGIHVLPDEMFSEEHLPCLRSVHVPGNSIQQLPHTLSSTGPAIHRRLESLDISGNSLIRTLPPFDIFMQRLPSLVRLDMSYLPLVYEWNAAGIHDISSGRLASLRISGTMIRQVDTPSRLQYLPGRCMMTLTHSLVDIDFSHQDLTESDSISFLVYCRHLQYLDLSFNPKLHLNPSVFFSSTRFTDSIGEGLPLYKNSLLSVDVSGCSNFDDLDIWFGLCSSLSEMHARKCSSSVWKLFRPSMPILKKLIVLDVAHCEASTSYLCSEFIPVIAEHAPCLKHLGISFIFPASNSRVVHEALQNECKSLERSLLSRLASLSRIPRDFSTVGPQVDDPEWDVDALELFEVSDPNLWWSERNILGSICEADLNATNSPTPFGIRYINSLLLANKSDCEDRLEDKVRLDRVIGVLLGQMLGDSHGLRTEFFDRKTASLFCGFRRDLHRNRPPDAHRLKWLSGDCTDDTDQALRLIDSLYAHAKVLSEIVREMTRQAEHSQEKKEEIGNIFSIAEETDSSNDARLQENLDSLSRDFSSRLFDWALYGLAECNDDGGLGLGRTVRSVLTHHKFHENPCQASLEVWIAYGENLAANGALMRTSPIGCLSCPSLVELISAAFCRVTHRDPRCVASCVAGSLLIHRLVYEGLSSDTSASCSKFIQLAIEDYERTLVRESALLSSVSNHFEPSRTLEEFRSVVRVLFETNFRSFSPLRLSDRKEIGFTNKCFLAGLVSLGKLSSPPLYHSSAENDQQQPSSRVPDILAALIAEAGDADTNGAFAMAVLGAAVGSSSLCADFSTTRVPFPHLLERYARKLSYLAEFDYSN